MAKLTKEKIQFSVLELEFLWVMCYSVAKRQVKVHQDYYAIAEKLEPLLYRAVQALAPGWEHPLKQTKN